MTGTIPGQGARSLVAPICVAVLCALGFAAIAASLDLGWIRNLDESWLHAFRAGASTATEPSWTLTATRDLSALGSVWVMAPIVASVCVFLALERRFASLVWILATTVSGYGLSKVLKLLFARTRPEVVAPLEPASGYSFPSGHTMVSAIVYLGLAFLIGRSCRREVQRFWALTVALLVTGVVGVTRVRLGVHYPSDVLAGWLAGAAWATGGWLLARVAARKIRP